MRMRSLIKAIGGVPGQKIKWILYERAELKELSETRQPLFTELKKLDPLQRYPATKVAKMVVFHTFVKLLTRIPDIRYRLAALVNKG